MSLTFHNKHGFEACGRLRKVGKNLRTILMSFVSKGVLMSNFDKKDPMYAGHKVIHLCCMIGSFENILL